MGEDSYARFEAECKVRMAQLKRVRDNARRRETKAFAKLMATPEWQAEQAQRVIEHQEYCIRRRVIETKKECQNARGQVQCQIIMIRLRRRRGLAEVGLGLTWRDYRRNFERFLEAKQADEDLTMRRGQVVVGKGTQQLCLAPRSITTDHDTSTPCCSTIGIATSGNRLTSSAEIESTSGTGRSGLK